MQSGGRRPGEHPGRPVTASRSPLAARWLQAVHSRGAPRDHIPTSSSNKPSRHAQAAHTSPGPAQPRTRRRWCARHRVQHRWCSSRLRQLRNLAGRRYRGPPPVPQGESGRSGTAVANATHDEQGQQYNRVPHHQSAVRSPRRADQVGPAPPSRPTEAVVKANSSPACRRTVLNCGS